MILGDTFSCPFEQRSLNVDVERLKNPTLETSWTEHMLITPIKPNIFPHSAMPNTRPKGNKPPPPHTSDKFFENIRSIKCVCNFSNVSFFFHEVVDPLKCFD